MSEPSSSTTDNMKISIDPSRARILSQNLQSIQSRITQTLQQSSTSSSTYLKRTPSNPPRLVAVSKLKPASDILALHQPPSSSSSSPPSPQHHFGENYVQELIEKSQLLPQTIKWHFIGGLQSNKCAQVAREVPNLWAVESVDSIKKANLLNKGRGEAQSAPSSNESTTTTTNTTETETETDTAKSKEKEPLRIFIQVNTSGEESKSGLPPKSTDLLDLCAHVYGSECPNLKLQGLMTIGAIARSQETTAENVNEDFEVLRETRDWVVEKMKEQEGKKEDAGGDGPTMELELELSMGMSEDFEGAIVQGSDEVRVGSTIFGERPPKSEAKVV